MILLAVMVLFMVMAVVIMVRAVGGNNLNGYSNGDGG